MILQLILINSFLSNPSNTAVGFIFQPHLLSTFFFFLSIFTAVCSVTKFLTIFIPENVVSCLKTEVLNLVGFFCLFVFSMSREDPVVKSLNQILLAIAVWTLLSLCIM